MASSKLAKTLEILSKPPERRSLSQLSFVASYFGSVLEQENTNLLRLMGLYMKLHLEEGNLSKILEQGSQVFLLSGTIVLENKTTEKQTTIEAPSKAIVIGHGERVYLQDRSIAASLTGLQYRNCVLICEESSIDGEMQFFQQNNYFSRVGLITCLTLINNLEVKRIVRGQKAGSLSNSGDFVHLVRSGELQICKETEEWTGVRSTLELISFPAGEFFGFYQFRESTSCEYIIKCKSAYCTLFAFDRKFFESYIQVICGDKLKAYQSNLTKYLEKHEDEAGQMRKINMKFLTQTNFNQRKSTQQITTESTKTNLPTLPSKELINHTPPERFPATLHNKSLSSRQLKHKQPPFEQLSKLQFRRSKCEAYERLRQPLPLTRNEIFYDFFKNNWETSYAKRKLSDHRRY